MYVICGLCGGVCDAVCGVGCVGVCGMFTVQTIPAQYY